MVILSDYLVAIFAVSAAAAQDSDGNWWVEKAAKTA